MEGLCDVLVESVLEGFGEGFCQFFRKLREVKAFECINFCLASAASTSFSLTR